MTDEVLSSWVQIPNNVLEEVALRMSMVDRLHVSSVCKTWRDKLLRSSRIWNGALACHVNEMGIIFHLDRWLAKRPQAQFSEVHFYSKTTGENLKSWFPLFIQTLRSSDLRIDLITALRCFLGRGVGEPAAGELTPRVMQCYGIDSTASYRDYHGRMIYRPEYFSNFYLQDNYFQLLHHLKRFECHVHIINIAPNCLPISLESLSVRAYQCSARLGPVLRNLPKLTLLQINIVEGFQTDQDLWILTQLTHLGLGRTTDSLWASLLCRLTKLRSLHLFNITNPTVDVASLSTLQNLTSLALSSCSFTQLPPGVVELPNLAQVELLSNPSLRLGPDFIDVWKNLKEVCIDVPTMMSLIDLDEFVMVDALTSRLEALTVYNFTGREENEKKTINRLMDLVVSKAGKICIKISLSDRLIQLNDNTFQRLLDVAAKYPGAIKVL